MNTFWSKVLLIAISLAVAYGTEAPKSDPTIGSQSTSPAAAAIQSGSPSAAAAPGPEARQVPPTGSVSNSPVYPYNLYQNSLYGNGYEGSSSGSAPSASSIMSFLRSPQGGRRSSLTSRLRNLMNSLFFRETSSPYMTSGSSYSYQYRQPPPFGFSSLSSSSLPSSYGSSGPNFLTAASGYRPVVFPNYPSSGPGNGNSWSNYKQWSSSPNGPSSSSLTSSLGSPGGTNYAWSSGSGSGPSSGYPSSLISSAYGSGSGSIPSSSSYGSGSSSGIPYQAASSNSYPSAASSYGSGSSYPGSTPYQRSSNSNFKPVANSGPVSSSVVSSSSSNNPVSTSFKQ